MLHMMRKLKRWVLNREKDATGAAALGGEGTRRVSLISVLLVALLLFAGACQIPQTEQSVTCTPEMRAFFEEFAQYDGRELRPTGTGRYCGIRIGTSDSEEEVFAYYSGKLRENGWEVTTLEFPDSPKPTDIENRILIGRQEGQEGIYYYEVNYEPLSYDRHSSAEPFIRVDVTWRRR